MKRTLLTLLAALAAGTLSAQDRSPTSLPPEAAARLKEGWKKLQGSASLPAPSFGVVVIASANGKQGSLGSPAEQVIADELRSQIVRLGMPVVSPELVTKGLSTAKSALERLGEGEVAARTAELLSESTKADIMLVVELMLNADQSAIREFRVYDVRQSPSRLLTSQSYKALPLTPPVNRMDQAFWFQEQRQGVTAMLQRLADATAEGPAYLPTYRMQVLGLSRRDHERWLRALRQNHDSGFEIVRLPAEFGTTQVDVTPLWIRFPGDWPEVKDLLNASAESTLGRSLATVFDNGANDFILALRETKVPPFFRYTAEDAGPPPETVGPVLSSNRRPTVAILYGADLDTPQAALQDERLAMPSLNLDEETTVRLLNRYFKAAGFEVKDAASLRRKLEDEMNRSKLTKNLTGMRDALRRLDAMDYLVLVRPGEGGKNLSLTVLDRKASQVAFTSFPDLRYKLYADDVDVRDPLSLTRYLSGTLLAQLYDQAKNDSSHAIEVIIRNIRDTQQVLKISGAFRIIDGVQSVTDLKIDQPLASFIVNTREDAQTMLNRAAYAASRNLLGAKGIVEVANEQQLILNLAPEWLTPFDTPEAEIKMQELQKPEAPKKDGLVQAMRDASDSVWIVGLELPDGLFTGGGTAWTVRRGWLATNHHVLDGLIDQAKQLEGGQFQVVARNGPNLERRIVLDLARSKGHPAYVEFNKLYGEYTIGAVGVYDVALLATDSDAGPPLSLASPKELESLQALDPIGYVGFPQEDRVGGGRSQQKVNGVLSGMSTVFMQDSKDYSRRLIMHYTLPIRGGASGSPLFGPDGKVIGLVSAGDAIFAPTKNSKGTSRVPVGFNYAQRVDMLMDLLDSKASVSDINALKPEWDKQFREAKEQLAGR